MYLQFGIDISQTRHHIYNTEQKYLSRKHDGNFVFKYTKIIRK